MKITKADFITSATFKKQYPKDDLPEIALAGRSNVGKSSFLNRIIQRKKLARTSSRPGRTQTLNFYKINDKFYFVDVPGYGYAQVPKQERSKWGQMMEEYFELREYLQGVILLTDARHDPTGHDIQMYQYMKYIQLPTVIVATKIDKVPKHKQKSYIQKTATLIGLDPKDSIVGFSAKSGQGKSDIWSHILPFTEC